MCLLYNHVFMGINSLWSRDRYAATHFQERQAQHFACVQACAWAVDKPWIRLEVAKFPAKLDLVDNFLKHNIWGLAFILLGLVSN